MFFFSFSFNIRLRNKSLQPKKGREEELLVNKDGRESAAKEGSGVGPVAIDNGDAVGVSVLHGVGIRPGGTSVIGVEEQGVKGNGGEAATNNPALLGVDHLDIKETSVGLEELLGPSPASINAVKNPGSSGSLGHSPAGGLSGAINGVEVKAPSVIVNNLKGLASIGGTGDDSDISVFLAHDVSVEVDLDSFLGELDAGGQLAGLGVGVAGFGGPGAAGGEPGGVGGEGTVPIDQKERRMRKKIKKKEKDEKEERREAVLT